MTIQERAREWLNKMGLSTSVQSMFRAHSLEALLQSVADETWEEAARLHESIKPASDDERIKGHPGAGAMGAVIEYRDALNRIDWIIAEADKLYAIVREPNTAASVYAEADAKLDELCRAFWPELDLCIKGLRTEVADRDRRIAELKKKPTHQRSIQEKP